MTAVINGSSPTVTFSDGTTQATSAIVSGYVPYANLPAGSVLQVVSATTSTQAASSNSTWIDSTLTVTITPKYTTSKIFVIAQQNGVTKSASNTQGCVSLRLVRDSTALGNFSQYSAYTNTTLTNSVSAGYTYLDSPATTSATVYKTQFCALTNVPTAYVQDSSTVSSITVMEIAG